MSEPAPAPSGPASAPSGPAVATGVERALDTFGGSGPAPDWAALASDAAPPGAGPAGPAPGITGSVDADPWRTEPAASAASDAPLEALLARLRLRALLQQLAGVTARRPEAGLALAFASGLLLATIIKRLGRR